MKQLLQLSLVFIGLSAAISCKKDPTTSSTNNNNNNTTTACNGKSLCFKMDGAEVSKDAKLKEINVNNVVRNRVYWEDAATGSNIEIDVYGTTTGSYSVSANPTTGQAGFQYYLKDASGTKNIQGSAGTIDVTALANGTMTGKFTVTASDGSKTYQITDGNFVNVAK
jgi:hypothetical protein